MDTRPVAPFVEPPPLVPSILATLAYADLFDYPLTLGEIARYQVGTHFGEAHIAACLSSDPYLLERTTKSGSFYALRERESVFRLRAERAQAARRVWRRAHVYTAWVARLPYVRMIAVTGALAVDNLAARPDIDLLVVSEARRVWVCRRGLIVLVRLARLFGDELCPNYILSEGHLDLQQRDLFTAHELAQMVPLYGPHIYRRMIEANGWARRYLPCAFLTDGGGAKSRRAHAAVKGIERVLRARPFDSWERWEQRRLQSKLRPLVGEAAEVICSPEQCKGHTGLHRQSVTARYAERLRELGLYEPLAELLI